MSAKNVDENFMEFSSPSMGIKENVAISPGSNPFDTLSQIADSFDIVDIKKDSLYLSKCDDDCGRESLGILKIDLEKIKFDDANWSNVPELQVNNNLLQTSFENLPDKLNTALLYSRRNSKLSIASSIPSSVSSFPESLDWEISGTNINSFSMLNKAFIKSGSDSDIIPDTLNEARSSSTIEALNRLGTRIQSLPGVDFGTEKINNKKVVNPYIRNFQKSESLLKRSFTFSPVSKGNEIEDNNFNDSIFIEAKHIAEKIADNSILHLIGSELYLLDSTPQPELIDLSDTAGDENEPNYTDHVFKAVDRMIPDKRNDKSEVRDKEKSLEDYINKTRNSTSSNSSLSRNECLQNLSDVFNADSKKMCVSKLSQCSNKSKSRDAKSILDNLSQIINNENRSERQKSEGQNLLFSLADILCSDDNKLSLNEEQHSEDSGHSSIDQDILRTNKHEVDNIINALDLRPNTEAVTDEPLDLSILKTKTENEINRSVTALVDSSNEVKLKTSLKLCNNSITNRSKNGSAYFNDTKNLSNRKNISGLSSLGKLKPKKLDKKVLPEKGPLKAMIPVGNMSKAKGINKSSRTSCTPTKNNHHTSGYKAKRTTTPKTSSKPEPLAQSTPDGNSNLKKGIPVPLNSQQRRFEAPVSPLARTRSIGNESTDDLNTKSRSGSAPNLSRDHSKNESTINNSRTISRRHSATDLKISSQGYRFRRSNTIDKDAGIAKTLNHVRENIEKYRNATGSIKSAVNVKPVLNQRNRVSAPTAIKPCNLANRMKRSNGKENILQE